MTAITDAETGVERRPDDEPLGGRPTRGRQPVRILGGDAQRLFKQIANEMLADMRLGAYGA